MSRYSTKHDKIHDLGYYRDTKTPFYVTTLSKNNKTIMKKTYHLCLSGGDEVLFRDLEDYHRAFNSFALALYNTDSNGLAEAIMATHIHKIIQTENPNEHMHFFRRSYCAYFNHKYHREGRLGEKHHFTMEVVGYHHLMAAISYVLRNAVHHGVAPTPYAYPHCSANAIFRKEMGKFHTENLISPNKYYRHIGRRASFPDSYKMTESGIFLRESVLDIPQVENLFVTPRSFNYYMNRKSSEEWEKEQEKDGESMQPISLLNIEAGVQNSDITKMLTYEHGKTDYRKISDIELCTHLDQLARSCYKRHSVYQLSQKEKLQIANDLYHRLNLGEAQIRRCLALHK